MSKYGHRPHNWFESIVNKLGGEEAAEKFLRGELVVSEPVHIRRWREQDGVIYFSVTSDGTTGKEWIGRLKKKGFGLSRFAKKMLSSSSFRSTKGVTTEIAILRGSHFENRDRTTGRVHAFAAERKLTRLTIEIACLIREKLSDEDIAAMGLVNILTMHEPIKVYDVDLCLLELSRGTEVNHWLGTYCDRPDYWLSSGYGFAFAIQ